MLPLQNRDAHLFQVEKTMIFIMFNDFYDSHYLILFGFGPKAPGAHGTLIFGFFEILCYGLGPI